MDSPPSITSQPAPQTPEQQKLVEDILYGFSQARLRRYNFEGQWQESALLIWPEWANTFFYQYDQMPGQKKSQMQIDSSVSIASHRFAAIVDSLMTPYNEMWSSLAAEDEYLMKQRGVKEYYGELSKCLWRHRYRPSANFIGQNTVNWQSLGVFGNHNMFVEELNSKRFPGERGLSYTSVPVGQMYYLEDSQGMICGYYRAFKWSARKIYQKWPDTFPAALVPALEQRSETLYWVVQFVCPRDDWQPWRIDAKGKQFASYYVSVEGHCILEESGYRSFPMASGRYMQAPDEDYGRGPAQIVLASTKTLNAEKGIYLKAGHRAGDPMWITADDGLMSGDLYPGALISGAMTSDGKAKIAALEGGKIQITQEMMAAEKLIIDDAFLVTLFQLALKSEDTPQMTARQVVEMVEQKGMLLGPTIGRQMTEYLGGLVPRELDVLACQKLLPPMHPAVREAGAEYKVCFSNPMMRAMMAGQASGFMQMIEMTTQVAQSSGDATVWDNYDFDTALPDMAENRGVPVKWLSTPSMLAQKRKQRAAAAAEEAKTKQMPAQAAIIKAQAISQKAQAGQNIGGTLAGVPGTQMPGIPGNPAGLPGQPGIGGAPGQPGQPG